MFNNAISTSLSGLQAQSLRVATTSGNIANAGTSGAPNAPENAGGAYQARDVQLSAQGGGGVSGGVEIRNPPTVPAFDPDAPGADKDGFVAVPNVNLDEEVVNLLDASNQYKANAEILDVISDLSGELTDLFS